MIMNIVFGLIPEFLYYFLFISKIKQLDKKNIIWFFILTFINCFLAVLRINHNFIMYVMFDIAEYLILKVLYRDKTCITDFFLLLSIEIYLLVISGLCYFLIPNYMIAYVINRIIIFAPLIFINKIRYFYKKYRQMWNRNDSKNEKIVDLQREVLMKDLQASQTAQNAFIAQGLNNEVDALYNRLSNCPVPSTPVYGRTPIFTCPNNNGCGCGYNTTSQFI